MWLAMEKSRPGRAGETRIDAPDGAYQVLTALKANRRKRGERGEIIVEGVAPIKVALAEGWEPLSFCYSESLSDWARGVVGGHPEAIRYRLSPALMAGLSDRDEPSEIIMTVRARSSSLADIALDRGLFAVVLDRPGNPGNLGSIMRSAEAFGATALITLGHGADPFEPACIRASLGAAFSLPLVREPSMEELESWLARARARCPGLALLGTDSGGELDFTAAPLRPPIALAFGNEAKGLSVRLKALLDGIVSMPMSGSVDSLNLACAASIFIHQVSLNAPPSRG
jgi:TrmH family RNA methyltransferase